MPGLEEAVQAQTGDAAGRGARAAADLALDHDRAQRALGAVLVAVEAVHAHEGEELARVAQQAFGQCLARMLRLAGIDRGQAIGLRFQLARSEHGQAAERCARVIIERPDLPRPVHHRHVGRVRLLQGMQIARQMDPTALVRASQVVIGTVVVGDQVAGGQRGRGRPRANGHGLLPNLKSFDFAA